MAKKKPATKKKPVMVPEEKLYRKEMQEGIKLEFQLIAINNQMRDLRQEGDKVASQMTEKHGILKGLSMTGTFDAKAVRAEEIEKYKKAQGITGTKK